MQSLPYCGKCFIGASILAARVSPAVAVGFHSSLFPRQIWKGNGVDEVLFPFPEPPATVVEALKDISLHEGEDAVFQCRVSQENAKDVAWSLAGVPLQSNEMNEIEVKGKVHSLTLRKVALEDSGLVSFRVGQSSSESRLTVQCK